MIPWVLIKSLDSRPGYWRGESLISTTSSWELHAHPTELHSDQRLAARGRLLQECLQPFCGGPGDKKRLKHGGSIGMGPTTWVPSTLIFLDVVWFRTRTLRFYGISLHGYWALGPKGGTNSRIQPVHFLGWSFLTPSSFVTVMSPFPKTTALWGCGNSWFSCSPVVPHSGQSAACLFVGPKRFCDRCRGGGGGRTWKDTWRWGEEEPLKFGRLVHTSTW